MENVQYAETAEEDYSWDLEEFVIGKDVLDSTGGYCGVASGIQDSFGGPLLIEVQWRTLMGRLKKQCVPIEFFEKLDTPDLKLKITDRDFKKRVWHLHESYRRNYYEPYPMTVPNVKYGSSKIQYLFEQPSYLRGIPE